MLFPWSTRAHRRRPRLFALLEFRDERRFLAGWLENVAPQVDGILALDDGSTDGSASLLEASPNLLELVRSSRAEGAGLDKSANRIALHAAAARHGADWLIAVDADERLERRFRARAHREIVRLEAAGLRAASVRICELWDRADRVRVDGRWGAKRHARLFAHREDAELDLRPMHAHWAPLDSRSGGGFAEADLIVYHLQMVRREDREARRRRWEERDPHGEHQAIGYAHLTDETGLQLAPLPRGRGYLPRGPLP